MAFEMVCVMSLRKHLHLKLLKCVTGKSMVFNSNVACNWRSNGIRDGKWPAKREDIQNHMLQCHYKSTGI